MITLGNGNQNTKENVLNLIFSNERSELLCEFVLLISSSESIHDHDWWNYLAKTYVQ